MPISPYVKALREKIGNDLLFLPSVCGLVFNDADEVLLGRRSDNGKWAAIAGGIDPGETPADAVVREVLEEAGVHVRPERITGVYLTPRYTYPGGNQAQYVNIAFRCRHISGTPHVADDESLEIRYFRLDELPELMSDHRQRVEDAARGGEPFFKPATGGAP